MLDRLEVGGVEKVALQQVRALRSLGHDAELVLLRGRGGGLETFAAELRAVPVRVLEERLPAAVRGSLPVPGFAFLQTFHFSYPPFARALIHAGEYDCILCHGTYTLLTALAVQRARGIPVAGFVWDPAYHVVASDAYAGRAVGRLAPALRPIARALDSMLVRSSALVVLGGSAYEPYVRALGARKVLISYPGTEPVDRPLPAEEREPEALAVTAWKAGKRPEKLLDLVEPHTDLRLVLAGAWLDDDLRRGFLSVTRARGLTDRVEITGPLSEAQLGERYGRARFAVQTWSSPGFGLSPLEAAAHATTFVVPREQGSAEIFREDVDGLFFSSDTDLGGAFARLAVDPTLAARLGASAWEWVRTRHSWAVRGAELAASLRELVVDASSAEVPAAEAEHEDV